MKQVVEDELKIAETKMRHPVVDNLQGTLSKEFDLLQTEIQLSARARESVKKNVKTKLAQVIEEEVIFEEDRKRREQEARLLR